MDVFDGLGEALAKNQAAVDAKAAKPKLEIEELTKQEFDALQAGGDDNARDQYLALAADAYSVNRFGGYFSELNAEGKAKLLEELRGADWESLLIHGGSAPKVPEGRTCRW